MSCDVVTMPDGARAIVCSRRKAERCDCGRRATLLCDWKVPGRRSGTCDRPICSRCATSPAPGKDLCQEHAVACSAWRASRSGRMKA